MSQLSMDAALQAIERLALKLELMAQRIEALENGTYHRSRCKRAKPDIRRSVGRTCHCLRGENYSCLKGRDEGLRR